jgi:hypothetical protein
MSFEDTNIYVKPYLHEIRSLKRNSKYMRSVGFDSETIHGAPMSLQFWNDKGGAIELVTERNAEKTFFRMLEAFTTNDDVLTVVFCHNLSFDMLSIFPTKLKDLAYGNFNGTSYGWNYSCVHGRPSFGKFSKGRRRVLLVDTGRFCRAGTSLHQIAESYCPHLPKLRMPSALGEKLFTLSDASFVEYALRDAQVAYEFGKVIITWHDKYNVQMSLSGPHFAAQVFRRQFVTDPIPLPASEIWWAALRAYHGGIQRAPFAPGYWPEVRALDIVSAYPHAMSEMPSFTQSKLYKAYHANTGRVPMFGVYKVSGRASDTAWPILFDKNFKGCVGDFTTNATGLEINAFLDAKAGTINKVQGYYYDAEKDKRIKPMEQFVRTFFRVKSEATDKTERDAAKLLLNSLYGKFIQTRIEEEPYYDADTDTFNTDTSLRAGGLFNPFIAALITGHTRARLCGLERSYSALHSATDGIITAHKKAVSLDNGLGGITQESAGSVVIVRPKLYVIYTRNENLAIKDAAGNKRSSTTLRGEYIAKYALHGFRGTVEQLEDMLQKGKTEYEYTHVVGLKESLKTSLGRANDFIKRTGNLNYKVPE